MAHVVLFHHALGLTDGVRAFAERLRAAGHAVTTPDLFDGRTFDSIDDGVAHAESIGFLQISELGYDAAAGLPDGLVAAGFSLGALPALRIAQTRPGAVGGILYHSGVPVDTFADSWPTGVGLQLHVCEDDPWGDVDEVKALAAAVPDSELYTYPGSEHLVTDESWHEFDAALTAQIVERSLGFLASR